MNINLDYSGKTIGKYYLRKKLGRGQFGSVYSAVDLILKTDTAVKIMNFDDPAKAHALFLEAEIPYKCKHHNIVEIKGGSLELFENEPHFIIDMELINGGSLEGAIYDNTLSVIDTLLIAKGILFGLQHSHHQGIIHRDIKPANILISNGIAKLTDFGLATALNSIMPSGTSQWYFSHAAPEIWINHTATVASDIYAMGMTLFRAVNGIADWESYLSSVRNAKSMIISGTFVEKAAFRALVPKKVIAIVKKACKPDPSKRYSSAAEMRNAIEKLQPKVNWHQTDDFTWTGQNNDRMQTIELSPFRSGFEVLIKNNGRKSSQYSKKYSILDDAKKYIFDYIASTTLN